MKSVFHHKKGGENLLLGEPGDWMPGPIGRQAIGGMMAHLPALTAIGASTVNSYRRMLDLGMWAPVYADWGYQNRTTSLRVSAPGRFEFRAVDSMVNPVSDGRLRFYKAFDDGIKNKIDPGEPQEQRNIYAELMDGRRRRLTALPRIRSPSALDALAGDDVIKSALPGNLYDDLRVEYKT